MSSWGTEARVGAFLLAALAVLVGFIVVLGDYAWGPRQRLAVDFGYTGGLQVGAPVRLSGIKVGKVADLRLIDSGSTPPPAASGGALGQRAPVLVRAELALDSQARRLVTRDALFYVGMQGVIGEAYVELTPASGPALDEGQSLRGVDAPRLHVIALQLAATLETFHRLVGLLSPEQVDGLGAALGSLVGTVDGVLSEHRAELSQAVVDLTAAAAHARASAEAIHRATQDGGVVAQLLDDGGEVAELLRSRLPGLLERGERSMVAFESLAVDARDASADAKTLLAQGQHAAKLLDEVAEDAHHVVRMIRQGQGSVGALINDPELYDDMKEMMRDLRRHPWKVFWRD